MAYQPNPVPTEHVRLSADLLELSKVLAVNNHDVWARQRLANGWHYGPRRDDDKKEHPGLVPYEELSESEKEYDRQTALETLKAIQALGYHITRA